MRTSSSFGRGHWPAWIILGALAAVVVTGLASRHSLAEQLRASAADQAIRTVAVATPTPVSGSALELPARIEAWSRAPIYARVSGYLKRWDVDIGGAVKAGQELAEIETPDLDQQLQQAQAELTTARTNAALAASTSQRWQSLLATDAVSKQEAEEKAGDQAAKQSAVSGLQANVERLRALQQFKRLHAPFDGVITARNTDVGSLINVGMTPGSELFVVADVRRLRVYVRVPQRQVALIRPDSRVQVFVPERPDHPYAARLLASSKAIDAGSGAMLVQLAVDNANGELLPGGFATVRFEADGKAEGLALPPSALIFGKAGVQIATVDAGGLVKLKSVTIARDMGKTVELAGGVDKHDQVITNPPDGLDSGDHVHIAAAAQKVSK